MKTRITVVLAALLLSGGVFEGSGQIRMYPNNNIEIRNHNSAIAGMTTHYGDLRLLGGVAGINRGRLICNNLSVVGTVDIGNSLYIGGHSGSSALIEGELLVIGPKRFIHPHPTDDNMIVRYTAIESGEILTVARGIAATVNGEITITLPEHFSLVTSRTEPVTVVLTPEGAPVLLYTRQKSTTEITVAMRRSDYLEFRDVEFSYQVTGVRDGFGGQDVIVNVRELDSPTVVPASEMNDVQRRIAAYSERFRARREAARESAEMLMRDEEGRNRHE